MLPELSITNKMSAGCFLFSAISVISAQSPVLEPTSPLLVDAAGPVVPSLETAPVLLASPPLLLPAALPPVLAPVLAPPSAPPLPVGSCVVPLSPAEAPVTEVTEVNPPEFPAVWPRVSSPLLQANMADTTSRGATRRETGVRRGIMGNIRPRAILEVPWSLQLQLHAAIDEPMIW
jgi:hypothetical protein